MKYFTVLFVSTGGSTLGVGCRHLFSHDVPHLHGNMKGSFSDWHSYYNSINVLPLVVTAVTSYV